MNISNVQIFRAYNCYEITIDDIRIGTTVLHHMHTDAWRDLGRIRSRMAWKL